MYSRFEFDMIFAQPFHLTPLTVSLIILSPTATADVSPASKSARA